MIRAACDTLCAFMKMTGHADAAPKGQDVVCAAASMLMYTLAAVVREYERGGLAEDVVTKLEPGWAFVACRPAPGGEPPVRAVFDMALTGARLLAEKYPAYVECVPPKAADESYGNE